MIALQREEDSLKYDTTDLQSFSSNYSSKAELRFYLQRFGKLFFSFAFNISRKKGSVFPGLATGSRIPVSFWFVQIIGLLFIPLFTGHKGFQLPTRMPSLQFFPFFYSKRNSYSSSSLCSPEVKPRTFTTSLACSLSQITQSASQILEIAQCAYF